jgi:hypothetical protein
VNLNTSFGESGRMGLSIFSPPFHVEKTTNYFNYLIFTKKNKPYLITAYLYPPGQLISF